MLSSTGTRFLQGNGVRVVFCCGDLAHSALTCQPGFGVLPEPTPPMPTVGECCISGCPDTSSKIKVLEGLSTCWLYRPPVLNLIIER